MVSQAETNATPDEAPSPSNTVTSAPESITAASESNDSDSEAPSSEVATATEATTASESDPTTKLPSGKTGSESPANVSEGTKKKKKKRKKKKKKADEPFKDFHDFNESLTKLPFHRILAINRGDRSGVLRVRVSCDEAKMKEAARKTLLTKGHLCEEFLAKCVDDAMQRLILPSLEREIRRELTENAERHAVEVFSSNLRHLLLQRPTNNRTILAIDPGFKRGCSVAVLDCSGNFITSDHVFVVGNKTRRDQSLEKLAEMIKTHQVELIAIGNGTACRETEQMVSSLISEKIENKDVRYVMVNEAGASVYSTSEIGREEFPEVSPNVRSAISIGRRLIDPLSELVKIAPANIGVGMYQHDVKAKHLAESLDQTVEFCVNRVGVNVNTASPSLLRYVSGLNQLTAHRIYEYRKENGPFKNREGLKKVAGFGQATFVQAAGFLRINDGDQPLDATSIHPESYAMASAVLERTQTETSLLFQPILAPKSTVSKELPPATEPNLESTQSTENETTATTEEKTISAEIPTEGDSTQPANVPAEPADESTQPANVPAEPADESTQPANVPADPANESTDSAPVPTEPTAPTASSGPDVAQDQPTDVTPKETPTEKTVVSDPVVNQNSDEDKEARERNRAARLEAIGRIKELDQNALAKEFGVGRLLVKDIVNNLIRPQRDPREGVSRPIFRRGIIKVDDLKPGMVLDGQVVNVVDFGVFVDIGLGESSLVHVSQLSNRYIQDPHQHFSVGEVIKVWVSEIDAGRRRVKLTAINPEAPKKESRRKGRSDRGTATKKPQRGDRKRSDKASKERVKSTRTRRTPKPVQPITQEMLDGKKPMRSFSDLLQFVEKQSDDKKKK